MSALSPTRRAARATLPARGRERNGATSHSIQSMVQVVLYEILRCADAGPSLPLTGGWFAKRTGCGDQKGVSDVQ